MITDLLCFGSSSISVDLNKNKSNKGDSKKYGHRGWLWGIFQPSKSTCPHFLLLRKEVASSYSLSEKVLAPSFPFRERRWREGTTNGRMGLATVNTRSNPWIDRVQN